MFTVEERDRVREHVLQMATHDTRVVAGAVVGSLALGGGDRWSDLDLTFAVTDEAPLEDALADWTRNLVGELGAVQLFDLPSGPTIYRVFLLPGCLQVDVSVTPASEFRARGPKFRLLFGSSGEPAHAQPPSPREVFGMAVHHAVRARVCIERGRYWEAEHWISDLRESAMTLACIRERLPWSYARGFDDLPRSTADRYRSALAVALEREPLLRALESGVERLLEESSAAPDVAAKLGEDLRELSSRSQR